MKQILYVILNDTGNYWAGDSGIKGVEWWATYFTEAKYFTNKDLAEIEKQTNKIKGHIHKIIIAPIKI